MNPLTKILGNDIFPVDFQLTKILNIPSTIQTLQLFLLGMGDEESLVLYEFYFPLSIRRGIAREAFRREKKKQSFSTYDRYGKSSSIFSASINQTFEAITADERLFSLMHIKKGSAIFMTTSVFTAGALVSAGVDPLVAGLCLPAMVVVSGYVPPMAASMLAAIGIAGSDSIETSKLSLLLAMFHSIIVVVIFMGLLPILGI